MGYYTSYSLEVCFMIGRNRAELVDDEPLKEMIKLLRASSEEALLALDDDGSTSGNETKWYEHQKEMKEFSDRNRGVLFILSGEGAENDDMWKEYYLNGKVQVEKAVVQIAPFDYDKLR